MSSAQIFYFPYFILIVSKLWRTAKFHNRTKLSARSVQPCSHIRFLNNEKKSNGEHRILLTWTGDVATVLCEDWFAWPAWSEQQWKSHSLEVGDPLVCDPVTGWWRRALARLPAHSTVWVCTVELSMELPWRDSCRGDGAPLIVMHRPGPRDPKKAPAAPDVCCFAPAAVSLSAFITVTRGVGWPPVFLYTSLITLSLSPVSPRLPSLPR